MKKLKALVLLMPILAACGKGAGDYVGYWQRQDDARVSVMEISKDGENYFLTQNLLSKRKNQTTPSLLIEKEGKLSTNVMDTPMALSEDGKTLFVGNLSFNKIDAAEKDKLVAHQEACTKLHKEYIDSRPPFDFSVKHDVREARKKAYEQKFNERFAELEKNGRCNARPL